MIVVYVMYTLCGCDKIEKKLAQSRVAITSSIIDRPVAASTNGFYLCILSVYKRNPALKNLRISL